MLSISADAQTDRECTGYSAPDSSTVVGDIHDNVREVAVSVVPAHEITTETRQKEPGRLAAFWGRHKKAITLALMVILQIIWTTLQISMKYFSSVLKPSSQISLRVYFGTVFLAIFTAIFDRKNKVRFWTPFKNWKTALLAVYLGLAMVVCNLILVAQALTLPATTAGSVGVITALQCLFIPLIGAIPFFHQERLNWLKLVAILIGFIGAVVCLNPVDFVMQLVSGTGIHDYAGRLVAIANVIQYSLSVIVSRVFMNMTHVPVFTSQLIYNGVASLFFLIILLPIETYQDLKENITKLTATHWILIVYTGAFGSCIGFCINFLGMTVLDPAIFGLFTTILPITNTLGGYIVFGEVPTLWLLGGVILVIIAIACLFLGIKLQQRRDAAQKVDVDVVPIVSPETLSSVSDNVQELA